ncbi:MAG: CHAT domain-containing protein [Bacteroidota bacterium]
MIYPFRFYLLAGSLIFLLACNDQGALWELDQDIRLALLREQPQRADSLLQKLENILAGKPQVDQAARNYYYAAQLAFDRFDFEQSLELAMEASVRLPTFEDKASQESNLLNSQLLTFLHWEFKVSPDSILYYNRSVQKQLQVSSDPLIVLRNQLCKSFAHYADFAWESVQNSAEVGLQQITEDTLDAPIMQSRLELMRAVGIKKQADYLEDALRKDSLWQAAASSCRDASIRLRLLNNHRWREIQGDYAIIISRFADRDSLERAIQPLYEAVPDHIRQRYGYPDRLKGYYINRRQTKEKGDSILFYYQRFLREAEVSSDFLIGEAFYISVRQHQRAKDYETALELFINSANRFNCYDEVSARSIFDSRDFTQISKNSGCLYSFNITGEILMDRYRNGGGNLDDLVYAVQLTDYNLKQWETLFQTEYEEKVLSQIRDHGYRVINLATNSAIEAWKIDHSAENADRLWRVMELGRSYLLLRKLRNNRNNNPGGVSSPLDSIQKLEQDRQELLAGFHPEDILPPGVRERIDQIQEQLVIQREELQEEFPVFSLPSPKQGLQAMGLQLVQTQLDDRTAILEYCWRDNRIIGLYLDQQRAHAFELSLSAIDLREKIRSLRAVLQTTDPRSEHIQTYIQLATELYRELVAPVEHWLTDKTEIILLPERELQQLPFAALLSSRPQNEDYQNFPYLIRDFSLHYPPSWQVAQLNWQRKYANPDTLSIASWTHPDLQLYFGELNKLLDQNFGSRLTHYQQDECRPETFKAHAPQYDIIQLSLHASGDPYNWYENHLQFHRDALIYSSEISALPNFSTQLLVLAACEGDEGQLIDGEGTYSLRRSFHSAGIANVVATQWEVPAAATNKLCRQFYQYYLAGTPATRALQLSQQDLIDGNYSRAKRRYAWPGFWAGMLVG